LECEELALGLALEYHVHYNVFWIHTLYYVIPECFYRGYGFALVSISKPDSRSELPRE
jgi:hypothetical protein